MNRSFVGVRFAVPSLATAAALLVAPAAPASASAGARYVAPSGSDSASCTRSAPCGSLERAYRLAAPGQTVRLASGTYSDTSLPLDPAKRAAQDVVIAGHDRDFAAAMIFPNLARCRELVGSVSPDAPASELLRHPAVLDVRSSFALQQVKETTALPLG